MSMSNEERLAKELEIVNRYIQAMKDNGWVIHSHYNGGEAAELGEGERRITDDEQIRFRHPTEEPGRAWLYFVYGNNPGEVLNDYTTNVEAILNPINEWAEQWA